MSNKNRTEAQPAGKNPASQSSQEEIAACAYLIWEQEGCPNGREFNHWLQAETQIRQNGRHDSGRLGATAKEASKAAA